MLILFLIVAFQPPTVEEIIADLVKNHFALTGPSREESEAYLREKAK